MPSRYVIEAQADGWSEEKTDDPADEGESQSLECSEHSSVQMIGVCPGTTAVVNPDVDVPLPPTKLSGVCGTLREAITWNDTDKETRTGSRIFPATSVL